MERVRRVRFLAIIAVAWWLFLIAKMVAFGTTSGQVPILLGCGLLLVFVLWMQASGRY